MKWIDLINFTRRFALTWTTASINLTSNRFFQEHK